LLTDLLTWDHFLLVARSDHTTGNRNIKPEVDFKVQRMARYASFCLTMGPFKGEVSVFARLWLVWVRVMVSSTTGAVRSPILATAGLLVMYLVISFIMNPVGQNVNYGIEAPTGNGIRKIDWSRDR